jgi:hypothetical protein
LNNVIKQDNMEGAALGTRMTDDGEEGEVRGKKQAAVRRLSEAESTYGLRNTGVGKSGRLVQGGG